MYSELTCDTQVETLPIEHVVTNFVDDSTSVISFLDDKSIMQYLTKYFKLLYSFYNINMLKINSDKTQLMLTFRKNMKDKFKKFTFMANNDEISNKPTIKILGMILRNNMDWETQIGTFCSNLHHRIHNIKNITKYTDFKTRLQLVKSFVVGKLIYCMPLYSQINRSQETKIHRVIMSSARTAIGSFCFKKSISYI